MPPLMDSSAAFAIFVLFILLDLSTMMATLIPTHEVDDMLTALHSLGPHNLIANAISTSDLIFDLLDSHAFTLFVPPDRSVFHLALALPSSAYIAALQLHSCPHRYSSADLRRLVSSTAVASIPTLLPPWSLRLHAAGTILVLDNVEVSFPGIFYSHNIAVHGISGTISLRDEQHFSLPRSSVTIPGVYGRQSQRHGHFSRIPRFGNRTNHSLKNHGGHHRKYQEDSIPFSFTPLPAPALMMLDKASPVGFALVPAPAPIRLDKANDNISGNAGNNKITTSAKGFKADPVDSDTQDKVYVWGSDDIYSLFDEFL